MDQSVVCLENCDYLNSSVFSSQTCPQCRASATKETIFEIYLNVEENAKTTELALLHTKLDNLQRQITTRDRALQKMNEEHDALKKENAGLREENKEQENKIRVSQSAILRLNNQVTCYERKINETKNLEEDLRRKLEEVRIAELVLTGTPNKVNMLQYSQDPRALLILVETLKKALIESDKSKKQRERTAKVEHDELVALRKKLHNLKTASLQMRDELDSHQNCEQSLLKLKSKCQRLSSETPHNISRVISESPTAASQLAQSTDTSPSVPAVVETITHSDSPHLPVQTSSVGLPGLSTCNQLSAGTNKQPSLQIETLKRPSTSYDGLGGHSEDEEFPSRRSSLSNDTPRTTSNAMARKFKKLGPRPNLKM